MGMGKVDISMVGWCIGKKVVELENISKGFENK